MVVKKNEDNLREKFGAVDWDRNRMNSNGSSRLILRFSVVILMLVLLVVIGTISA